jgi:hypothetical protein
MGLNFSTTYNVTYAKGTIVKCDSSEITNDELADPEVDKKIQFGATTTYSTKLENVFKSYVDNNIVSSKLSMSNFNMTTVLSKDLAYLYDNLTNFNIFTKLNNSPYLTKNEDTDDYTLHSNNLIAIKNDLTDKVMSIKWFVNGVRVFPVNGQLTINNGDKVSYKGRCQDVVFVN